MDRSHPTHNRQERSTPPGRPALLRLVERAASAAQQPVQVLDDGNLAFRASQLQPLWSMKAISEAGRAAVMVAFGVATEDDDYQLIGMSVPDTYELMRQLQEALDSPLRIPADGNGRS